MSLTGETLQRNIAKNGLFNRLKIPAYLKPIEGEIRLGRCIIDRAVQDAVWDPEAYAWFNSEDEDFIEICFLANLDPERVVERFRFVYSNLIKK